MMIVFFFLIFNILEKEDQAWFKHFFLFEFCFFGCFEVFTWLGDMFSIENMLEKWIVHPKNPPFIFMATTVIVEIWVIA
jgi:hypothetical protein